MAADEKTFKPGDTDNNLLRKILMELNDGLVISGGSIIIPGNVNATVVGGSLTSAGAVTIADGAAVTLGAKADVAVASPLTDPATLISLQRSIISLLGSIATTSNTIQTRIPVSLGAKTAAGSFSVTVATDNATATAPLGTRLSDGSAFYTGAKTGQLPTAVGATTAAGSLSITPATDVATATAPLGTRLSTGAAFYDAAKTGQLPSALGQAAAAGSLSVVIASDQIAGLNNVGGYTKTIKITPTVSTSPAYTAGDAVGGKETLTAALRTSNGTVILESLVLLDRANQKQPMEVIIFDADPSAATITDNTAFVYSTDDLKVVARISIAATDYVTLNSKAIANLRGLGVAIKGNDSSTSLYAALVTTGTPTFAATTDIQLSFGFLQD